jgi:hypothetical protein
MIGTSCCNREPCDESLRCGWLIFLFAFALTNPATKHHNQPSIVRSIILQMALRNNDQEQVQPQTPQGKGDTTMEGQDLSSLMRLLYSFQEDDVGATSATSSQTRTSQGSTPSPSCTAPECFGIVDSLTLVDCKKLDLDDVVIDETFEDDGVVTDDHFKWASRSSLLQVRSRTGVRRGEEVIYSVKTKG